jgi:hypothetical protein
MTAQQVKDDMKNYANSSDANTKKLCYGNVDPNAINLTGGLTALLPDATKKFMIKNPNTGMCIDDGGTTTAGGAKMSMFNCVPSNKNQQFVYDPSTNLIKNPNKNNLCVDNGGGTTRGATKMHLWNCDSNNNFQKMSYDYKKKQFKLPGLGFCLDDGGAKNNGDQISYWDCDENNKNQQFIIQYV